MSFSVKSLINYLFDVGLVGINSLKIFLSSFSKDHPLHKKEDLVKILFEYFTKLNEKDLKNICFEIINRYLDFSENKMKKANLLLYKLIIHQKKKTLSQNFSRWKEKMIKDKTCRSKSGNKSFSKHRSHGSINLQNARTPSRATSPFQGEIQEMKILTTQEKKLLDESRECTFKPQINSNSKSKFSKDVRREDPFSRLYKENEKLKQKRSLLRLKTEEQERKHEMTFIPKTNTAERFYVGSNFFDRQSKYNMSTKSHKDELKKQADEKHQSECTFSPQLCRTIQCQYDQPACIRLYEDFARRIQNKKILEEMRFVELSNISRPKDRSNYSTEVRTTEDLFMEHKRKKEKLKDLTHSIDKERGYTFKPNTSIGKKIPVTSSFEERNARVIEYKRLLEELGKTPLNANQKKYSHAEIEENNRKIVDRLYNRDLEKLLAKKLSNDNPNQLSPELLYKYGQIDPFAEGVINPRQQGHTNLTTDQLTFQNAENTLGTYTNSLEGYQPHGNQYIKSLQEYSEGHQYSEQ